MNLLGFDPPPSLAQGEALLSHHLASVISMVDATLSTVRIDQMAECYVTTFSCSHHPFSLRLIIYLGVMCTTMESHERLVPSWYASTQYPHPLCMRNRGGRIGNSDWRNHRVHGYWEVTWSSLYFYTAESVWPRTVGKTV